MLRSSCYILQNEKYSYEIRKPNLIKLDNLNHSCFHKCLIDLDCCCKNIDLIVDKDLIELDMEIVVDWFVMELGKEMKRFLDLEQFPVENWNEIDKDLIELDMDSVGSDFVDHVNWKNDKLIDSEGVTICFDLEEKSNCLCKLIGY